MNTLKSTLFRATLHSSRNWASKGRKSTPKSGYSYSERKNGIPE